MELVERVVGGVKGILPSTHTERSFDYSVSSGEDLSEEDDSSASTSLYTDDDDTGTDSTRGSESKLDSDSDSDQAEGDETGIDIDSDSESSTADCDRRLSVPAVPGFRFLGRRRARDFHKLFPQVPDDDPPILETGCALARDILLQGHLWITPRFVCFHSNIFGYVMHPIIPIAKIRKIEPKNTAGIFPNALAITMTDGKRYSFHSLARRDALMRLILGLQEASSSSPARPEKPCRQPSTRSGLSANEAPDSDQDQDRSESDLQDHTRSPKRPELSASWSADSMTATVAAYKMAHPSSDPASPSLHPSSPQPSRKSSVSQDDGPSTHSPTKLPPPNENEKILATETVSAPLGQVANLLFGRKTSWLRRFLLDVEKNRDLTDIPDFQGEVPDRKRYYEYTKPLNGPVGPKQTRCKCTEIIKAWNLEEGVVVEQSTQTPDVPSGNSFLTITSLSLAWAEGNGTRIRIGTWIEWSGKTWLKGPIEKGAMDGQASFSKQLVAELNTALSSGGASSSAAASGNAEPKKRTHHRRSHAKASTTAQPGAANFAVVGVAVALVLLVVFLIVRRTQSSQRLRQLDANLRFVQQELELWQWIDDRSRADVMLERALSNAQLEEAIKITEQRLDKLKANLQSHDSALI